MIGALTIMGIPPTSGFMSEWILFSGVLQTAVNHGDSLRAAAFGFGILATVLSSAYILWMYKRIFFGKTPEQYVNVKDPNRYVIVTMAVLAAMTLVLGVYPDPLLILSQDTFKVCLKVMIPYCLSLRLYRLQMEVTFLSRVILFFQVSA